MSSSYKPLKIKDLINETIDSKSIVFSMLDINGERFSYRPGQFLTLRIPRGAGFAPRCYSLASSPYTDLDLKVSVKRVQGGHASNWICDTLKVGDVIEVLPPAGIFTPQNLNGDFILFSGGSGITPIMSILKSCLSQGAGKVKVFYANKDTNSIIFKNELDQLSQQFDQRLEIHYWLDDVNGYATTQHIKNFLPNQITGEIFICGPGPFMNLVETTLLDLNIDASLINVERFISLPDEGSSEKPLASGGISYQLKVHLDGETHDVEGLPNEFLLDAMLRNGIAVPYSCQEGVCSSCMCKVEAGKVTMLSHDCLSDKDMAAGWVVACKSLATTEQLVVKFS